MLALKSRMGFKSDFYGNVDEYSIAANNLVLGLTKLKTFRECVDYFSEQRQDLAFKSGGSDSKDFRERHQGTVYTLLNRIHRFTAVLNYISKNKNSYATSSQYFPNGENEINFPFRKITLASRDPREDIWYQLMYAVNEPKIFDNEIVPWGIMVEDNGTPNRIEEHTQRFNKISSLKSLIKFVYYLARNVVHIRGGGSFAEYMAIAGMLKMNMSIGGLNPDRELWCLAVSSSRKEFEENFLDIFIVK